MPQNPNRQVSLSEWEQRVKKHYGIGDDEWTRASQAGAGDGDPFEAVAARGKALAAQKQLASLPTETPPGWDTPIIPIRPQAPAPVQESVQAPVQTVSRPRPKQPRQTVMTQAPNMSPWMPPEPTPVQNKQADRRRRGPVLPQYQGEGFMVNPTREALGQVTGQKLPAKIQAPKPVRGGLARPGTPSQQAPATPQAQPQRPGFLQDIVETALPFAAGALAPIVSKAMTTPAEGSIRQAVNTAGQAYSKGLAQIPQGVAQFGEAVTRLRQLAPQQAPADGLGPVSRIFDKPTQTLVKGAEQRFPTNKQDQSWMTSKIPQVLGSVGAFATTGGVGQALGLPGMASSAIAGTGMQVASFMDEVKQTGIDPARINQGVALAGLTGMTEMFGLGKVLDKFGVKKQVIERGLNILEEAGQEAFQGYLEDINAKLVAANDPNRNIDPNSVDFWLKRGEEAALGAIGGGLFGGADILTQRIATNADGGAAKVPDAAQQETTPPQASPAIRQTAPVGTEPLTGPPGAPEQAQAPDNRTAALANLSSKPEALKVALEQIGQAQQQFERSLESGRVEDAVTALKRKEQALREARNKVKGDTPEGLRKKQQLWDEIQSNKRQIDAVQAEQKRQKAQPTPQAPAPAQAQPIAPAVDENAPTAGQPVPPVASVPTGRMQEQPQELAQAVGRKVKVGGQEYTLTPEQEKRWVEEVEQPFEEERQFIERNNDNADIKQKRLKALGMKTAAKKREIVNALTPKEQEAKARQEQTAYGGKRVSVNGKPGVIAGPAVFGRAKVRFDDGSEQSVPVTQLQGAAAPAQEQQPIQGQPQELAQAVGQTGTPSARMRGPSPNILSGRPRPGRVLQFPSQQPAGTGLLREPTNRIDSNQDYPGGEVQRTAGLQPEGQPVEAPTRPRSPIPQLPPEQIKRRRQERAGTRMGVFGKLSERAHKTNEQRDRPALVEHPELRELLGLPPMPPYKITDETGEERYNKEWQVAAQDTLNSLAILADVGRSSEIDPDALRGVYASLRQTAQRYGREISDDLKRTFKETFKEYQSATEGYQNFIVDESIVNIINGVRDAAARGQQLDKRELSKLKANITQVALDYGLAKNFAAGWTDKLIRRFYNPEGWRNQIPLEAAPVPRNEAGAGRRADDDRGRDVRLSETPAAPAPTGPTTAELEDTGGLRNKIRDLKKRGQAMRGEDKADQAAMAAEGRRTSEEATTETRTQGSGEGERTGGQVAAQVDQAAPRVEEARREPEADNRFAGYKTIVGKRTGYADDPYIFAQGKPVNDIFGNPTGWVKRTDFNPMKATTQGYVAMYNPVTKERIDFASALEAQNFAIDNANEYTPSVPGELEIKPVFKQPVASESPAQPAPAPATARAERPSAPAPEQPAQPVTATPTKARQAKEAAKAPPAKKRAKVADLLALGWTQVHSQEYRKGNEWRLVRNMEHRGSEPFELTRDGEVVQRFGALGDAINSIVEQGQSARAARERRIGDSSPVTPTPQPDLSQPLTQYLAQMPAMQKGRALATLTKPRSVQRQMTTHADYVEQAIANGARVSVRANGQRALILPDGGFFYESDLSKHALDYAEHLQGQAEQPPQAQPAAQPEQAVPAQEQPVPAPEPEAATPAAPATPPAPEQAKEPWQMTREEFENTAPTTALHPDFATLDALSNRANFRPYDVDAVKDAAALKRLADAGLVRGRKNFKVTGEGHSLLAEERAKAKENDLARGAFFDEHYEHVLAALKAGKPVPAEVLADYPDLQAQPKAQPEQAKPKQPRQKKAAPPNLADIMPPPGRPMEMKDLKQKLRDAGMPEGEIDKFILDKKASYEIALMKAYGPDDVKARTTEAERAGMVQDQFGNWYNGATRRTEQETKEAQTPAPSQSVPNVDVKRLNTVAVMQEQGEDALRALLEAYDDAALKALLRVNRVRVKDFTRANAITALVSDAAQALNMGKAFLRQASTPPPPRVAQAPTAEAPTNPTAEARIITKGDIYRDQDGKYFEVVETIKRGRPAGSLGEQVDRKTLASVDAADLYARIIVQPLKGKPGNFQPLKTSPPRVDDNLLAQIRKGTAVRITPDATPAQAAATPAQAAAPPRPANRVLAPTPEEAAKVAQSVDKEKPIAATGLTKTQTAYLVDKLEEVAPTLPTMPEGVAPPRLRSRRQTADAIAEEEAASRAALADLPGTTIPVPGDGQFTVKTFQQANNLYRRLQGGNLPNLSAEQREQLQLWEGAASPPVTTTVKTYRAASTTPTTFKSGLTESGEEGIYDFARHGDTEWGGNRVEGDSTWMSDGHSMLLKSAMDAASIRKLRGLPKENVGRIASAQLIQTTATEQGKYKRQQGQILGVVQSGDTSSRNNPPQAILESGNMRVALNANLLRQAMDATGATEVWLASSAKAAQSVELRKAGQPVAYIMPLRADAETLKEQADAIKSVMEAQPAPAQATEPKIVADARKRVRKGGTGEQANVGIQPLLDQALVTGYDIYKAGMSFAQWSRRMLSDLGQKVRPYLRQTWDKVRAAVAEFIRDEEGSFPASPGPPKRTGQPPTPRKPFSVDDFLADINVEEIRPRKQRPAPTPKQQKPKKPPVLQLPPTKSERLQSNIISVSGIPRALMASADLSAPLRQGAILSLPPTQWTRAARASVEMLKALSPKQHDAFREALHSDPDADLAKGMGLFLATDEIGSNIITGREEDFISKLAGKIPIAGSIIRGSERAYTTYLDSLRLSTFKSYLKTINKMGGDEAQKQRAMKAAAKWINMATGRGSLGEDFDRAAPMLSTIFFAPRYVASRINVLNPLTYTSMPGAVRVRAIGELMQYGAVVAATLALAKAAGATVSLDADDPDFLKIRFGNTRYDVLAGTQQIMRLFWALGKDLYRSAKGEPPIYGKSALEVAGRFARSKLAPVPSFFTDMVMRRDFIGRKFEVGRGVLERVVPLMWKDVVGAYQREGIGGALKQAPGFFGIGVQDYEKRSGTINVQGGRFGKVLQDLGLEYSSVRPKTGEPDELFKERADRVESWLKTYGEKLVTHPRFSALPPEQQKAAITRLRSEASEQSNMKQPKLAGLDAAKILLSVQKSARKRPARDKLKIYVEAEQ